MKFDTLIENYLNVFSEAYVNRSSKYSNIDINSDKLIEKLNAGDFDILITTWANNPKYGNISEETIKKLISDLGNDIKSYEISSFNDLKETINSLADGIYEGKGMRRQSYVERLTNSIASLVMHKEYELVTAKETVAPSVSKPKIDPTEEIESSVIEYIKQAELPTPYNDAVKYITSSFAKEEDFANGIIKALLDKNFLIKQGNSLSVTEEGENAFAKLLEIEDENTDDEDESLFGKPLKRSSEEDPFKYAPEVEDAYRSTTSADEDMFGSNY